MEVLMLIPISFCFYKMKQMECNQGKLFRYSENRILHVCVVEDFKLWHFANCSAFGDVY